MTKIIKSDFIKNLKEKFGLTQVNSKLIVEEFFNFISEGLMKDKQVFLSGIGILRTKTLKATEYKVNNDRYEKGYKIFESPTRKKLKFSTSNVIIKKIN